MIALDQVDVRRETEPADLDQYPEVDELLERLEMGRLVRESVKSFPGRNRNWVGTTTTGQAVFVKRITGDSPADNRRRFDRIVALEELAPPEWPLPRPQCLGWDQVNLTVAFAQLADARSGFEIAESDLFEPQLAETMGEAIGALHDLPIVRRDDIEQDPPRFPSLHALKALTLNDLVRFSAGEIQAWTLLQNDEELIEALRRLRAKEAVATTVPSHADLRLDQFLFADDTMYLIDWEDFRLADPARDLGSFAGEWLYRAMAGIGRASGWSGEHVEATLDHDEIIRRGLRGLAEGRPLVAAFLGGYERVRGPVDRDTVQRATGFAGWHLIDRLVAIASQHATLAGMDLAAAGVGRRAVVDPARHASAIGLEIAR